MQGSEPNKLIRLSEACRLLGICVKTGRIWAKQKTAPMDKAFKNGSGYWMVPLRVVREMVGE